MADGTFREGDRLASYTIANGDKTDHIQKVSLVGSAGAAAAPASLGPQTSANSLSVVPSTDQNPIFDHANGTKTSVTTTTTIITTGAGHTFLRISTDVDLFVNTAGSAAVDDGTSIRIVANQPEVIPVPPSTAIKALSSSGTATVRCTPLKVR